MTKIAFITCADLSRFFPSSTEPLFTHDDQIAVDYLRSQAFIVEPVIWGANVAQLAAQKYDALVVRSPWDYMNSAENRLAFVRWLIALHEARLKVLNSVPLMLWNLDKHYLRDLNQRGVPTVPTVFLEPEDSFELAHRTLKQFGAMVIKPCISAAAQDTFLVHNSGELEQLPVKQLRSDRAFMLQPFLSAVCSEGEWSLVFLNGHYSHAVLKKPQVGLWLVQDELGGSVESAIPLGQVLNLANQAFEALVVFAKERFNCSDILYARIDVIAGQYIGEVELIEPELFFLERSKSPVPNMKAVQEFCIGLSRAIALPKDL